MNSKAKEAIKELKKMQTPKLPALNTLAKKIGCSHEHLGKEFKAEVGMSYSVWRSKQRLSYAKKVLRKTSLPIIDITYDLGFKHPSTFSAWFKKQTDFSPTAYREKAQSLKEASRTKTHQI